MAGEPVGAGIELTSNPAKLVGRLVAEVHQMLADHRQLGPAVPDPLRKHLKERLQRARFGSHRDDRPREFLSFLAPRPAEHQPCEAEQCKRAGRDRDPLRDRGRGQ